MTTPKFYITTAIAYPNGAPHVGHAYEVMATALKSFDHIDLVYGHNDPEAYGAYLAAKDAGQRVKKRKIDWDPKAYPVLTWRWRLHKAPNGSEPNVSCS